VFCLYSNFLFYWGSGRFKENTIFPYSSSAPLHIKIDKALERFYWSESHMKA
jgi:hypothetical protein